MGLLYCLKHNDVYESDKNSKKCDCNDLASISNKRYIKWILNDKPALIIKPIEEKKNVKI